jgi:7-cyano-7-deazaguanine synthase
MYKNSKVMSENTSQEMISLYDYLGYAAGNKLGKQVAKYAADKKTKFGIRRVSNPKFTGEVILYTREFLDEYFKKKHMKKAVLSLSGGMDSSTLLLHLLAHNYEVTALSFDYGQKHKVELERAKDLVSYINAQFYRVGDIYPKVKHQVIKIDGLQNLLNSALVEGGKDVPEGHYEQENMKETVVPNRNKIFSSLIQAVALSLATKPVGDDCSVGQEVVIALGVHAGDHAVYLDCRGEFRDADMHAFKIGNWNSELVNFYTPYLEVNKYDILVDGANACKKLGLDFNEVYKRTNTSYKPYPSGNSDYKSAASVERVEAFIKLGRPDPVQYEDEDGLASWDKVVAHVSKVLEDYKNK